MFSLLKFFNDMIFKIIFKIMNTNSHSLRFIESNEEYVCSCYAVLWRAVWNETVTSFSKYILLLNILNILLAVMQKKWLLDYEVKEAKKISRAKAPRRNKNQERDGDGDRGQQQRRPLTEEEHDHVRSYSVLMPLASKSLKKLDDLLIKAVTADSRSSGIGSYGGHIARERGLPGPLNGKQVHEQGNSCVTSPFYVKLKKKKPRPVLGSPDELNPTWNKNFVNDHINREKHKKLEKDKDYELLKVEMQTFLKRAGLRSEETHAVSIVATQSDPHLVCCKTYTYPQPLPEEALDEWADMLSNLFATANEVQSNDLMEISSWVHPPPAAVDIIGFFCVLLNINPDWATAKRLLLRNIPALLNFIRKVQLQ